MDTSVVKLPAPLHSTAILLLLLSNIESSVYAALGCRNGLGVAVDWWVAIKFPGGGTYCYIDSESQDSGVGSLPWEVAFNLDAAAGNPLAATLQQLYHTEGAFGHMMWNDEFPSNRVFSDQAHSKGVLAADLIQGFWLTHSMPRFPPSPCLNCSDGNLGGDYSGIMAGQKVYAQSAVCLTADTTHIDEAARTLSSNGLYVYSKQLPQLLALRMPGWTALQERAVYGRPARVPGSAPIVGGAPFRTLGGQPLLMFAKAPSLYPVPLHEAVIQPALGAAAMSWETWQHGQNVPQTCGNGNKGASFTIASIVVPRGASWTVYQDHSKWGFSSSDAPSCCPSAHVTGVAAPGPADPRLSREKAVNTTAYDGHSAQSRSNVPAICFADLNRQVHQAVRGGGAVCFIDSMSLRNSFAAITSTLQPCAPTATI